MMQPDEIAAAFIAACETELDAPKPGNVHVFAGGHGMEAEDFVASARAAAPFIAQAGASIGQRILGAVEATLAVAGQNTNLGIVLLCAPLAAAAESAEAADKALETVLEALNIEDAELAFRAIALASPGGLGKADQHDVRQPAAINLLEAMRHAAGRDMVAAQYANQFDDVLTLGLPLLRENLARWSEPRWATLSVYLEFLGSFPDSHIVRKYGPAVARKVQAEAAGLAQLLAATDQPELLLPALLAFDATLKTARLNPGTSADLTVATLFAHRLNSGPQSA